MTDFPRTLPCTACGGKGCGECGEQFMAQVQMKRMRAEFLREGLESDALRILRGIALAQGHDPDEINFGESAKTLVRDVLLFQRREREDGKEVMEGTGEPARDRFKMLEWEVVTLIPDHVDTDQVPAWLKDRRRGV